MFSFYGYFFPASLLTCNIKTRHSDYPHHHYLKTWNLSPFVPSLTSALLPRVRGVSPPTSPSPASTYHVNSIPHHIQHPAAPTLLHFHLRTVQARQTCRSVCPRAHTSTNALTVLSIPWQTPKLFVSRLTTYGSAEQPSHPRALTQFPFHRAK